MNIEIELQLLPNGKPATDFHIAIVTDRKWWGGERTRRYCRLCGNWMEENLHRKAPHALHEYLEYRLKLDIAKKTTFPIVLP